MKPHSLKWKPKTRDEKDVDCIYQIVKRNMLVTEIMWSAMLSLKENPKMTIEKAVILASHEWLK